MHIRQGNKEDVANCLAIDPSYITDRVWQLAEQTRGEETTLTFRLARLPRPLRVEYPRPLQDLAADMDEGECFLVAEQDGNVAGFIDLAVALWHEAAWLRHLVVVESLRRRGVGARLLRAALSWGESNRLRTIMAECQTKNYPVISLYQKNGFVFCGYNDRYYANKDITLFFAHILRK